MDLFELQRFYASQFPGKKVDFEFDDNCHRQAEIIYSDGKPHEICHVECHKVKVAVEGQEPTYITIAPHRFNTTWSGIKRYLSSKTEVFIHPDSLRNLKELKESDLESYEKALSNKMDSTGMSKEKIESMMQV